MSSPSAGSSQLLAEAAKHEKKYEWREAARCYDALPGRSGESAESVTAALRSAECHELAAYQTDDAESFRGEIESARSMYLEVMQRGDGDSALSLALQITRARQLRLESILISEIGRRRELLDEAIAIHQGVLKEMERREARISLKLGNFHLALLSERLSLEDGESMDSLLREALTVAEKMVSANGNQGDPNLLAETYSWLLFSAFSASRFFEGRHDVVSRRAEITQDAVNLIPRIDDKRALALLYVAIAYNSFYLRGQDAGGNHYSSGLAAARITGDRQLIGRALSGLAFIAGWRMSAEHEGEPAQQRFEEVISYCEEAKKRLGHLSDASSQNSLLWAYTSLILTNQFYAAHFVTDPSLRTRLIRESAAVFLDEWQTARKGGGTPVIWLGFAGAEALRLLATLEVDSRKRREQLEEAVSIIEIASTLRSRMEPLLYAWVIGSYNVQEGSLRYDLAQMLEEPVEKKAAFEGAMRSYREGLRQAKDGLAQYPEGTFARLGDYFLRYADALKGIIDLTGDNHLVPELISTLEEAADTYAMGKRPSRVAEVLWERAKITSPLGQHNSAKQDYARAADLYATAARETPSLRELYTELSQYMLAWREIEDAREMHSNAAYADASKAYERASSLLKSTERWSPLSELYLAFSNLEKAETAAYQEDSESAVQLFSRAADGFSTSQVGSSSWDTQALGAAGASVVGWEKQAVGRERYCRARAELENAKLLNRKGDHGESARRFASAKGILETLAAGEEKEERQELGTFAIICAAWQAIEEAEASGESRKYTEAARFFEQAAQSAASEKMARLSEGHAAYCDAMGLGIDLRSRRDPAVYRKTKEFLELAIDSYNNAGVGRGALWARGTERVLDGLTYLAQAESELDVGTKSQLYALSE